jgi:hypothetical protein
MKLQLKLGEIYTIKYVCVVVLAALINTVLTMYTTEGKLMTAKNIVCVILCHCISTSVV